MTELATSKSELVVDIYPRGWDVWRGTTAQLKAEGVVPSYVKWPQGDHSQSWSEGSLTCELRRCRPPGMKGPRKIWIAGNYWLLRRCRTATLFDGLAAARIYKKQNELARKLWQQTPDGVNELKHWLAAKGDKRFQAFLVLLSLNNPLAGC